MKNRFAKALTSTITVIILITTVFFSMTQYQQLLHLIIPAEKMPPILLIQRKAFQ